MKKLVSLVLLIVLSLSAFNNIYAKANDSNEKALIYLNNLKAYKNIEDFELAIENKDKDLVGNPIQVSISNSRFASGNVLINAILINGITYINVNDFANILNLDNYWIGPMNNIGEYSVNSDGYAYMFSKDGIKIVFRDMFSDVIINNSVENIDGKCIPVFNADGRYNSAYIPLRIAAEALDYIVEYNLEYDNSKLVRIYK